MDTPSSLAPSQPLVRSGSYTFAIPSHNSRPRRDVIFVGLALAEPPEKQRRARFQHVVRHHNCAWQQHTQLLHDRQVLVVAGTFPQVAKFFAIGCG